MFTCLLLYCCCCAARWSEDSDGNEYIVMELVPMGSLDKLLLEARGCAGRPKRGRDLGPRPAV